MNEQQNPVTRDVTVSGFDGATLSALLVHRPDVQPRALPPGSHPLLCLPGHLRPARTLLPFMEAMVERDDGPGVAVALDYRGRGGSEPRGDAGLYTPSAEAKDVVSVVDALGLHHVDLIADGRGGLVAMSLYPARPGLIRRLVLNDIGPELDGVGLARLRLTAQRDAVPSSWDVATAALKEAQENRYPALDDRDWERFARLVWREEDGRPARAVHEEVAEHFAAIDTDERYPSLWPEFEALREIPTLLLRAEHGDMVSERTLERMRTAHPKLSVEEVAGQGHTPLLHVGDLTERVAAFLSN